MATRMLIDAAHPEETRVVIVKGNRLEEFDFEVGSRKPLKGNIYLAKVTRVEPSLQAAFVEFGGNRHGFLAFNEIHPDYYQIPIADREALLAEQRKEVARVAEQEEAEIAETDDDEDDGGDQPKRRGRGRGRGRRRGGRAPASENGNGEDDAEGPVESVGGDEVDEEVSPRRISSSRPYKIQEVIKRRQIILVQVVKEERGNKGAALTTYLSLAGRYCVLMPNTARGGGISRKITNAQDRRKLKSVVGELEVPEGTGVIVRTAGAARTKSEIRRDFEFLLKLWDDIRDLTLQSTAPALVYEEASLITRAIRDFYSKEIEEVLVAGEEGYRVAKDFMKRIMPSHAKRVQPYRDRIPLLHRYQVEPQLDTMYSKEVTLPSGGYIVIDSAEALVAVDVNSGKSTRGRSVEETAYKTNLEAAEEVARQLRLRDLAGLIVIDFIDMEDQRNNRSVERKLKECLKVDRARIQVGRISHFGLLEMSRQRLRPGVQDVNMETCPHCGGSGRVRSIDSASLHILRAIEEEGIRDRSAEILVNMPTAIAIYVINNKRHALAEIEQRYGFRVEIAADEELLAPDFRIERVTAKEPGAEALDESWRQPIEPEEAEEADEAEEAEEADEAEERDGDDAQDGDEERGGRRRRSSRRRRRGGGQQPEESGDKDGESRDKDGESTRAEESQPKSGADEGGASDDDEDEDGKRRRRGRRGGRRRRGRRSDGEDSPFVMAAAVPNDEDAEEIQPTGGEEPAADDNEAEPAATAEEPVNEEAPAEEAVNEEVPAAAEAAEPAPRPATGSEPEAVQTDARADADQEPAAPADGTPAEAGETAGAEPVTEAEPEPAQAAEEKTEESVDAARPVEVAQPANEDEPEPAEEVADAGPPKRGWWRRRPRN
ncbi:ribonuclease E/G [Minwuia thermotolerans]|uniref:Ribonuclease E n=1 Tax=Minwuia thermotolerans TaxID=2056226 RepID=A0A2M9G3X8_9PROT|nr:ribonuclease E/G [Minwuia thermotolerans]PJK30394.1 ribonuclease E/G [Minwuia thermotolerans]